MHKIFSATFFILFTLQLKAQQTDIFYLSGKDKDHTVDWDFTIDNGMNSGKWTTIPVPSNWELQGFGVYNYGRSKDKQPLSDEIGQYRYEFEVPKSFKKKYVEIVFEGVMTDTEVKINGKLAGPVHQGGFYRFTYDITNLINVGAENTLEVKVKNKSDNAGVNTAEREADFWLFGGIYRPVYLKAYPEAHIQRTAVDAKADGSFTADVYLRGKGSVSDVEAQLYDMQNKPIGKSFSVSAGMSKEKVSLQTKFEDVLTWTPEFPNRYKIKFQLKKKSKVIHEVTETIGFRTVELREKDGIYVNGVKVMLKGVNRHTFWPSSGRASSRELSEIDVNLIKEMNMNAVRMSHYPPDVHFLEVCDSLGLFVLDELTGWQTSYDTEVGKKLVEEMMVRDVNHPSIIIWDNGNEGGWNVELDDEFQKYDPQNRPLIHPWEKFRGTDTQHYKDWDCCEDGLFHGENVFFPTEFLHGLYDGGLGAGLDDYYNSMLKNPLSAGGFLWVFSDEGVERSDQEKRIDTFANNAPDGILGPYREKEASFYTIKEIWSPIHITIEDQLPDSFDGNVAVENRYFYTSLDQCTFNWQLVDYSDASIDTATLVYASGKVASPSIPPQTSGNLNLSLPQDWKMHDALKLTAIDPHGKEIYTWTWATGNVRKNFLNMLKTPTKAEETAQIVEQENAYRLYTANTEVLIDRISGNIISVNKAGKKLSINGGPLLESQFGSSKLLEIRHYAVDGDYLLEYHYTKNSTIKKIQFVLKADGVLKVHVEYFPEDGYYEYIGVGFNYPEEKVTGVTWVGDGPYRVWKNRLKGAKFGLWQKAYNNTITGESWEYPEFKGYHANMRWAKIENSEIPFTIFFEEENLFLQLFTPVTPQGAYNENTDGYFPKYDLGIMQQISPIGTKFKKSEQLGPQGVPYLFERKAAKNPLEFTVYFQFGD